MGHFFYRINIFTNKLKLGNCPTFGGLMWCVVLALSPERDTYDLFDH